MQRQTKNHCALCQVDRLKKNVPTKKEHLSADKCSFFELSIPQAKRKAAFGREVRFARSGAEHGASLCTLGAILSLGDSPSFITEYATASLL